MGERYVNNMQQIMSANESQRNKIQFLQRERIKRDHYLSDLQQNLQINKKTLLDFNEIGNNDKTISKLIQETVILANKLKQYYEQYMNINATLLMEKQMRLEDKQFYQERMAEFQNKIVDLRKYLHDKEESFSSVVTRLRKYEDLPESTVQEKLHAFRKELGEKSTNEFITEIIKDKNNYKLQYERLQEDYSSFSEMKELIIKKFPQVQSILEQYKNTKIQQKTKATSSPSFRPKLQQQKDRKLSKKMQPNRQLIRLLKKQKLNNQLLEHALAGAIQKNEELIMIKSSLQKTVERLQDKCNLLYAQNTIFSLRLAQYDSHYCRKYVHHRKFYEEGQIKGLRFMTEKRLKQYAETVQQYYETNVQLHKKFEASLVEQVQKWGQFLADSHDIKKQFIKKNLLGKSASVPQLLINFQLDDAHQDEQMIIQEF